MGTTGATKARTNWLYVALAATVLYVAFIWLIIGNERIVTFLDTPALNEIGDFLAGVFAPIALIWLVAAVLTQRQELHETREQFEASQQVIEKQMDNANKQASINAMQYNLAQEAAKKQYRLLLFEKRYQIYQEFVQFADKHVHIQVDQGSLMELRQIKERAAFVFDTELEQWLVSIENRIELIMSIRESYEVTQDDYGNEHPLDSAYNKGLNNHLKSEHVLLMDDLASAERLSRFYHYLSVSEG